MLERRTLLSGLATLPLVGSAVALANSATSEGGVAQFAPPTEPVHPDLSRRYLAWLANEHAAILSEVSPIEWCSTRLEPKTWREKRVMYPMFWFPDAPDIEAAVTAAPASSRAGSVLSLVGVRFR